MSEIAEKVVALHEALDNAGLPHAFGGALALGWCTHDPRGTSDIDVNVFVAPDAAGTVVAALPSGVECQPDRLELLRRDGQARLRWGAVPVDIFLSTTPFHALAAERAQVEPFAGAAIPFLACADLAVFKVNFGRTRDWADLEDMAAAKTIDHLELRRVIAELLDAEEERLTRIDGLPW